MQLCRLLTASHEVFSAACCNSHTDSPDETDAAALHPCTHREAYGVWAAALKGEDIAPFVHRAVVAWRKIKVRFL